MVRYSYLDADEIRQCSRFACESWLFHNPSKLRPRRPIEVWYDVLQGKLSELTLFNYLKAERIAAHSEPPNFEVFQRNSDASKHDLIINDRKKEVKSYRQHQEVIRFRTSYFEDGEYVFGNPDDLVFIEISLIGIGKVGQLIAKLVQKTINWESEESNEQKVDHESYWKQLNRIFVEQYNCTFDTVAMRYSFSKNELLNDPLIQTIANEIDLVKLVELGYIAATTPVNKDDPESERRGRFTVLGEISVQEFLEVARKVEKGYILNLPPDPIYTILLKEFLRCVKETDERMKSGAFESFVHNCFHMKNIDYPALLHLPKPSFKTVIPAHLEKLNLSDLGGIPICQTQTEEYVLAKTELHPLVSW